MAARKYGEHSGIAAALGLVGERWALLIVRDLLVGSRRYSDLQAGLPRIPTNILSARLKELQAGGVVRRAPTVRGGYELTAYGRELEPIVLALERWGIAAASPQSGETITADSTITAFRAAFDAEAARALPATTALVHVGGVTLVVRVAGGTLTALPLGPALPAALAVERGALLDTVDVEFAAEPGLRGLLLAAREPAEGAVGDAVRMIRGDADALARFAAAFRSSAAAPGPREADR